MTQKKEEVRLVSTEPMDWKKAVRVGFRLKRSDQNLANCNGCDWGMARRLDLNKEGWGVACLGMRWCGAATLSVEVRFLLESRASETIGEPRCTIDEVLGTREMKDRIRDLAAAEKLGSES